MNPKPGEVWLVDLGLAAKMRPVVIVSRYDPNPPRTKVYNCGTTGMEVMFKAKGSKQLIIIDASSTGCEPGAVFTV
jgi:Ni,Fe-hydrogenase maturation factor